MRKKFKWKRGKREEKEGKRKNSSWKGWNTYVLGQKRDMGSQKNIICFLICQGSFSNWAWEGSQILWKLKGREIIVINKKEVD